MLNYFVLWLDKICSLFSKNSFASRAIRIQFVSYHSNTMYKLHRLIQAWGSQGKLYKGTDVWVRSWKITKRFLCKDGGLAFQVEGKPHAFAWWMKRYKVIKKWSVVWRSWIELDLKMEWQVEYRLGKC